MTISHMLCSNCSCTFAVTDDACTFCGSNDAASVPVQEPFRKSVTYGTLNRADYDYAWRVNMKEDTFTITNCKRVGTYTFTQEGLFRELHQAVAEWNGANSSLTQEERDAAGDWASCVLSVLGIEWV